MADLMLINLDDRGRKFDVGETSVKPYSSIHKLSSYEFYL